MNFEPKGKLTKITSAVYNPKFEVFNGYAVCNICGIVDDMSTRHCVTYITGNADHQKDVNLYYNKLDYYLRQSKQLQKTNYYPKCHITA